jgi:hypothetical protein
MPVTTLPFTNGFYRSESLPLSAQEAINCYPVVSAVPALSEEYVFGTPGIRFLGTSGEVIEQNRGIHVMNEVAYCVNGETLYRIEDDYTLTSLGTIPGTQRVSISNNGVQMLVLVPGGAGFIYDWQEDEFDEITDTDFTANGNPQYVAFVDGYFVLTTDEKKFIVSALNNGLAYNALDFGTAESDPDPVRAPIVFNNQLFIAGTTTIEAFQNIGGADFPFVRTGLFLNKGVSSPLSLIPSQTSFMFIGGGVNESPAVWALAGNSPQKVSTNAIDLLLGQLTDEELLDVYAWSYAQKGAYFVGFALPNTTIVYDISSGRWHERKSFDEGVLIGYRVSGIVTAYGRVLCSDTQDGRIGELDPEYFFEYDAPIIRILTTQPFYNNMQSVFFPSMELTVESGVGNDDCKEPMITMARSLDGKTWYDERTRSIGKLGEYRRRAIWRRNGRASRFEVFRFRMSDPVKFAVLQLTANVVGGVK